MDNVFGNQDPNVGVQSPGGVPAAIYRAEAGRTVRMGVRWSWAR